MIPAAFDYQRAASADEALGFLAEFGDEAKLLAGGHSLLPLMKLRLAQPTAIVDIGELRELSYIDDRGDHLAIGAMTRHSDVERSAIVGTSVPLLAHAAGHVGDPQVRNRGTLGGSLVHGDPASDLPAVALASGASMVIRSSSGERLVQAADFFTGFLETSIGADELLTELRFPKVGDVGWSFQKFSRRAQDWAIVGCAVQGGPGGGVALVNMGPHPQLSDEGTRALRSGATPAEVGAAAADGAEPTADIHADEQYRRHLAKVLVERAAAETTA